MKIILKNNEIQEYLEIPSTVFPKYTTQIINTANRNAQGTFPKVVGQLTEIIQEFPGNSFKEWVEWYTQNYPEAIDNATEKIMNMLDNLKSATDIIDKNMVRLWVEDLILVKTFAGLKFQEAILKRIAEEENCSYRLAEPHEESKGIDGFVGDKPYSIKPISYKTQFDLQETIEINIIFYEKERDKIIFTVEDEEKN